MNRWCGQEMSFFVVDQFSRRLFESEEGYFIRQHLLKRPMPAYTLVWFPGRRETCLKFVVKSS